METYLSQVEGVEDGEEFDMLAQTSALDEDLAQVADFLAQLEEEDIDMITNHLAQTLSSTDEEAEELLAQTAVEAEDDGGMIDQVATFMAQLSEEEIDSMESYLVQMESATQAGDSDTLAQLGTTLDENLGAIADYLVQLDDTELAQLTSKMSEV